MTIYTIYKKTHNKTGLQYLGYTKAKDPSKYKGSGKYWSNHIKLYGYDVTTEILFQTTNKLDIEPIGLHYSKLWNVVNSDKWANLIKETGKGGFPENLGPVWNKGMSGFRAGSSHHFFGVKRSDSDKANISKGRKGKGLGHCRPQSKESIEKIREANIGKILPDSTKKKIGDGNRGKPKPKLTCSHCGAVGGAPQMRRWHFDNCKLKTYTSMYCSLNQSADSSWPT